MAELGLQPTQKKPGHKVMSIQDGAASDDDDELEKWQDYFSKLFSIFFKRVRKIRNYKVQANFSLQNSGWLNKRDKGCQ